MKREDRNFVPEAFIEESIAKIREQVGNGAVLLAMSGGVDSSVCALLLHKAVGKQLTCVFVDHGCMRKGEPEQVKTVFGEQFGVNLVAVDAEDRFLGKLAGVTDPEQKRRIIGEEFIRVFEEEARKLGQLDYFAQGTIYPDVIESGKDGCKHVKAHHNVGGLPERIDFKGLVEPIRDLYKDEVRAVGRALGLPSGIVDRQPFPGPGLAVRCLGELTKEKLDILRDADAVWRERVDALKIEGLGQYFAILTGVRAVGVKNDARTYGWVVCVRAVATKDFMTAGVIPLTGEFLAETAAEIIKANDAISRVVYDVTPKPPATIEWE